MANDAWPDRTNAGGSGVGRPASSREGGNEEADDAQLTQMLAAWNQAAATIVVDAELRAKEIVSEGEDQAVSVEAEAARLVEQVLAGLRQAINDANISTGDDLLALLDRQGDTRPDPEHEPARDAPFGWPDLPAARGTKEPNGTTAASEGPSIWSSPRDAERPEPAMTHPRPEMPVEPASHLFAETSPATPARDERVTSSASSTTRPVLSDVWRSLTLDALLARVASDGNGDHRTDAVVLAVLQERLAVVQKTVASALGGVPGEGDATAQALNALSHDVPTPDRS